MLFCVIYLSPFTLLQHPGTGIDVRRRKIWNLYGGKTNLQVNLCISFKYKLACARLSDSIVRTY